MGVGGVGVAGVRGGRGIRDGAPKAWWVGGKRGFSVEVGALDIPLAKFEGFVCFWGEVKGVRKEVA